jgi:hypothetical protein
VYGGGGGAKFIRIILSQLQGLKGKCHEINIFVEFPKKTKQSFLYECGWFSHLSVKEKLFSL